MHLLKSTSKVADREQQIRLSTKIDSSGLSGASPMPIERSSGAGGTAAARRAGQAERSPFTEVSSWEVTTEFAILGFQDTSTVSESPESKIGYL
jgi:hypothetical protein